MSKSEQSPFDTFIDHRNQFETAEVPVREQPFVIEFVPISLAHFDQFFYDSSARINPAITTTMARHIVSQLEIEAVRSLCELDVKATIGTRYVDAWLRDGIRDRLRPKNRSPSFYFCR